MKRNIFLLLILIFLLGSIYYFEEHKGKVFKEKQELQTRLFPWDLNQIERMHFSQVEILSKNGLFFTPAGISLELEKVKSFYQDLSQLYIVRDMTLALSAEEKDKIFFKNHTSIEIQVKQKKYIYQLGERSPLSEQFYLKVFDPSGLQRIVLAEDRRPYPGMYQEDESYFQNRYAMLLQLLWPSEVTFLDLRLVKELQFPLNMELVFSSGEKLFVQAINENTIQFPSNIKSNMAGNLNQESLLKLVALLKGVWLPVAFSSSVPLSSPDLTIHSSHFSIKIYKMANSLQIIDDKRDLVFHYPLNLISTGFKSFMRKK